MSKPQIASEPTKNYDQLTVQEFAERIRTRSSELRVAAGKPALRRANRADRKVPACLALVPEHLF